MPDIVIPHDVLVDFGLRILRGARVPEDSAETVAFSLGAANLRGVDSHGFQLLPFYMRQIAEGNMDIQAQGHVVSESGGCLTYDGESGIGQVIARNCCDHAIRLAKTNGTGVVVARESNHFGAAAYWAQRMSAAGLIGIVMCNASPLVAPWQGKEKRFGTNPICMSLPGPDQWLLDMATTTVAMGKIFKASLSGEPSIPAGWAIDRNGVPTTETTAAMDGLPMPLGGYKGYGLAMMAEILCAVLSGGAMSLELGGIYTKDRKMRTSQFFLALDVARFMPLDEFEDRVRRLVEMMKSSAPAAGYDEVLVAGEPEWRKEGIRRHTGIPLSEGVWKTLTEAAGTLGVTPPAVRTSPADTIV
jgi:LDH2 family malate/lactate/ureidoglycolate dehydrogenase